MLVADKKPKVADDLRRTYSGDLHSHLRLPVREDDPYDYFFEGPAKLQAAGVKFAIATGDQGAEARDLPYQAGIAGAHGLPQEEALKAVTLYPAQILGVSDRMGSIEVGKLGNLVGRRRSPRSRNSTMFKRLSSR